MQFKERLLRTLRVRENEWWLVRQLFFQQFFSGAGIALFFTAAFTLFLQKFDISELPKVLIASAFVLWLTGFLFTKVEHLFPIKKLIVVVNLFIAGSILVIRIVSGYTDSLWFYFVMMVWYNVIYLLSSLDFWGVAALLFDVRQSKRLFGIISAGDIPAKLIGYISASVIAPFIGTENLLIVASISILYSLYYWFRLKKSGHLNLHVEHHDSHSTEYSSQKSFSETIKNFFQNDLVLHLAILSFIIMSITTSINFAFYASVKSSIKSDVMLASYVGLFLSVSRGVAIVMKLFFTNRITDALGIKTSLLISPVILIILLIPLLLAPIFNESITTALIIFGLLSITSDVLRSAIQTPVFLSVMQPLRANVRLRAHNIVKGIMDPFALFFMGIVLYFMMRTEHKVDLSLLSYMLLVLLILSIAWIFIVDREYVKMLVIALRNRYFTGKEIDFSDKETAGFFARKAINADETEVIFILHMLEKHHHMQSDEIIQNALHHVSDNVKLEAIKLMERLHNVKYIGQLKSIAQTTSNHKLLCEAIKSIYSLTDETDINAYTVKDNPEQTGAAITGMMRNGSKREIASQYLRDFISSGKKEFKIHASVIIGDTKNNLFSDDLIRLMNDNDDDISKSATAAAGKMHDSKIIDELLKLFESGRHEKTVLISLREASHHVLPKINSYIESPLLKKSQRLKLIGLTGKTGGAVAKKLLEDMIVRFSECRHEIILSLYQCDFKADEMSHDKYENIIRDYLNAAGLIVLQMHYLDGHHNKSLLVKALQIDFERYRTSVLYLFTFFYDTEKIQRARNAFYLNKKESVANALEIIDVTVAKKFSTRFISVFDNTGIGHKSVEVKKFINGATVTFENLRENILNDALSIYSDWTKACAVYELEKGDMKNYRQQVAAFASSENFLLKETAEYVLEN